MKMYVFMADGVEEVECLTVVDLMRRAGMEVITTSINSTRNVTGSHGITIQADMIYEDVMRKSGFYDADILFLPGGQPGTRNLAAHKGVCDAVILQNEKGKRIAAICAAPTVLGGLGILRKKKAVCYPGLEEQLSGAIVKAPEWQNKVPPVVTDGNITTSRGVGTAIDLALELVTLTFGSEQAEQLAKAIVYKA